MKRLLFILFILGYTTSLASVNDTTLVRDLSYDWFFYQEDSYLPLIDKSGYDGKTIHFNIEGNDYQGTSLSISSKQKVSVFINNRLAAVTFPSVSWPIDSLRKIFSDRMHFTLYNKKLNPYGLSTSLVRIISASDSAPLGHNAVIVKQRSFSVFNDFVIVAFIVLGIFLAALHNSYPRNLSEFFKISRALAVREIDENLLKSRPLNQINLLFYFFLCMLVALTLMLFINYSHLHPESNLFYPDSFWNGMWKWMKISFFVFLWLLAKYLLITNLSSLFRLGSFQSSHYFSYVRITLLIFSLCLTLLTFSYFAFNIISTHYYIYLFELTLLLMVVRTGILFFRLLNTSSYKTLHLFSYLCGTEVLPLVILLYLGLNQPF